MAHNNLLHPGHRELALLKLTPLLEGGCTTITFTDTVIELEPWLPAASIAVAVMV
jgi:hypothetical protein